MSTNVCGTCSKTKAQLECGICNDLICKKCAHILDESTFFYYDHRPDILKHNVYCEVCFNQNVAEAIDQYNSNLEEAKNIMVFTKSQTKETRLISRKEPALKINDCEDKDVALLKLAYMAVEKKFNSLIDVDVVGEKVRDGSYQTTRWHISGIPANVSDKKLIKDRSFSSRPN